MTVAERVTASKPAFSETLRALLEREVSGGSLVLDEMHIVRG